MINLILQLLVFFSKPETKPETKAVEDVSYAVWWNGGILIGVNGLQHIVSARHDGAEVQNLHGMDVWKVWVDFKLDSHFGPYSLKEIREGNEAVKLGFSPNYCSPEQAKVLLMNSECAD